MREDERLNARRTVLERLKHDQIEQLWVVYYDYCGRGCAKSVPTSGFESALQDGIVFAMANLDMDALGQQAAGATLLADSGDFFAVPDPRSYTLLTQYPGTARMHAWLCAADGSPWRGCPRARLEDQVERLAGAGYSVQVAFEPEFYLLRPGSDGALQPVNQTAMFSRDGLAAEDALIRRILERLARAGITVPQIGKEYGPGQYELACHHREPLQAVDDYLTLREIVRDTAAESGYLATFMPKVDQNWPGSSLHLHLSIWDANGIRDLTPASDNQTQLSDLASWFLGGLLDHAAGLTGLGSPSVNSYKRLQLGSWAPANPFWGFENRSGTVRIPGTGKRRRLEYRGSDNSCQPYLLLAGLLAAGLDGIERRLDPGPPFQGDAGHLTPEQLAEQGVDSLPRTLAAGLAALESDQVLAEAIGPACLQHLLAIRRSELASYTRMVHPWEREAYLQLG